MSGIETVGIVGAGAWGAALAINAVRAGRKVKLWGRNLQVMAALRSSRSHDAFPPGISLDPTIDVCSELDDLAEADVLLLAVPAQTISELSRRLPIGNQPLVICAKGLDRTSDRRLSDVLGATLAKRSVAALSGPNFAGEIARGLPAAATLGCADETLGRQLAAAMSHDNFRLYWTDDLTGVELGGAIKNVLAIAAGIVVGLGLGENAKAALITRGLFELTRLGDALGARRETLMGLAGLGDLLLTAGSLTSRNMAFGHAIGEGADPTMLQSKLGTLVEGVFTAKAVVRLAAGCQRVEVPICQAVDAILEGRLEIGKAAAALMTRPLKAERYGTDFL